MEHRALISTVYPDILNPNAWLYQRDQNHTQRDGKQSGGHVVQHGRHGDSLGQTEIERAHGRDHRRHQQWHAHRFEHPEEQIAGECQIHHFPIGPWGPSHVAQKTSGKCAGDHAHDCQDREQIRA